MCVCVTLSRVQLFATSWTIAHQAPLSMEFSRPEYCSGFPFPFPGDLPNPGIEPRSLGLPDSSVGKESACNAGDPSSIPGSGRSAGEGISYSLQYSWASLVAQLVRNSSAMWKTRVRSVDWEDPLETGKATHSSILAWRIPWIIQSMGSQRVGHD